MHVFNICLLKYWIARVKVIYRYSKTSYFYSYKMHIYKAVFTLIFAIVCIKLKIQVMCKHFYAFLTRNRLFWRITRRTKNEITKGRIKRNRREKNGKKMKFYLAQKKSFSDPRRLRIRTSELWNNFSPVAHQNLSVYSSVLADMRKEKEKRICAIEKKENKNEYLHAFARCNTHSRPRETKEPRFIFVVFCVCWKASATGNFFFEETQENT